MRGQQVASRRSRFPDGRFQGSTAPRGDSDVRAPRLGAPMEYDLLACE